MRVSAGVASMVQQTPGMTSHAVLFIISKADIHIIYHLNYRAKMICYNITWNL